MIKNILNDLNQSKYDENNQLSIVELKHYFYFKIFLLLLFQYKDKYHKPTEQMFSMLFTTSPFNKQEIFCH